MKRLLLVVICFAMPVIARFHTVVKDAEFDQLINKYEYAVVCFAPSRSIDKFSNKEEKQETVLNFQDLKKRLKFAADSQDFKKYLKQEVGFLLMDIASGKLQETDEEFGLEVLPTCLLFRQGRVVFAGKQEYAQLFDPISKYSILSFLNFYFKNDFENIIADKQEEEKLDRQERIAQYNAYALSGYPYSGYYGYPYGGYGWGGYPYGNGFSYSIGYSSGYGGMPGSYYGGGYFSRGW